MLTKQELCQLILNQELPRLRGRNKVYQSSSITVAMETLGLLINQEEKEYAASRVGVIFCGNVAPPGKAKEIKTLSLRELLELLPDEKKE